MAIRRPLQPDSGLKTPLSALDVNRVLHGDCLDVLRGLPDASVDAIVTDPPYGLGAAPDMLDVLRAWLAGEAYIPRGAGFMGKAWDAFVPGPEYWRECLRVLKPGGHALVFAGTRTWDVMGLALRLAGFELRDTLQWLYGSGFPKSHNISVAIDKAAKADRPKLRPVAVPARNRDGTNALGGSWQEEPWETAPATDAARQWDGWGTALKPAWEPIIVCRKPLAEPTVAANVLAHGVGALNIAASRVESGRDNHDLTVTQGVNTARTSWEHRRQPRTFAPSSGRWPANLLLSHSAECGLQGCAMWCPVRALDAQSGVRTSGKMMPTHTMAGVHRSTYGKDARGGFTTMETYGDTGGASRYFPTFRYQAKASRAERNRGCERLPFHTAGEATGRKDGSAGLNSPRAGASSPAGSRNHHPTVKPLALMSWLIGLITPPGGVVLDPFAGSGSTLCAAKQGGWRYVGIEREAEYVAIAEARLAAVAAEEPVSLGSAVALEQPKPVKKPRQRKPARPPSLPLWETPA